MGQKSTTVRRALCADCLQSFPEEGLVGLRGRSLCEPCRLRAEKVSARQEGHFPGNPEPIPAARGMRADAAGWCSGRRWEWRLPFLLWFCWILACHLASPTYGSLFKPLNLGIHELGHIIFGPLGQAPGMAGGTILQCLAPILAIVMFLRQKDLFAIAVCLGWLSTNLFDVATYIGDARAMALPLVRPGGGAAIHDWNFLLGRYGLLEWDSVLAFALRSCGTAAMAVAIAGGAWLLAMMAFPPRREAG
jgi:hypothetical protein